MNNKYSNLDIEELNKEKELVEERVSTLKSDISKYENESQQILSEVKFDGPDEVKKNYLDEYGKKNIEKADNFITKGKEDLKEYEEVINAYNNIISNMKWIKTYTPIVENDPDYEEKMKDYKIIEEIMDKSLEIINGFKSSDLAKNISEEKEETKESEKSNEQKNSKDKVDYIEFKNRLNGINIIKSFSSKDFGLNNLAFISEFDLTFDLFDTSFGSKLHEYSDAHDLSIEQYQDLITKLDPINLLKAEDFGLNEEAFAELKADNLLNPVDPSFDNVINEFADSHNLDTKQKEILKEAIVKYNDRKQIIEDRIKKMKEAEKEKNQFEEPTKVDENHRLPDKGGTTASDTTDQNGTDSNSNDSQDEDIDELDDNEEINDEPEPDHDKDQEIEETRKEKIKKNVKKALIFAAGAGVGIGLSFVPIPGAAGLVISTGRLIYAATKKGIQIYTTKHANDKNNKIINIIGKVEAKKSEIAQKFRASHPKIASSLDNINEFLKKPSTQIFINGIATGYTVGKIGQTLYSTYQNNLANQAAQQTQTTQQVENKPVKPTQNVSNNTPVQNVPTQPSAPVQPTTPDFNPSNLDLSDMERGFVSSYDTNSVHLASQYFKDVNLSRINNGMVLVEAQDGTPLAWEPIQNIASKLGMTSEELTSALSETVGGRVR